MSVFKALQILVVQHVQVSNQHVAAKEFYAISIGWVFDFCLYI